MRVLAILSSAQSIVYKVHDFKWDEETNHFFIIKLNIFVNRKRKMVNFDLGEEIERYFSSCQKRGTEKKFPWVPMRNGTSDLGILCSDALPLSHRNSMTNKAIKKLSKLKVYHLFYCSCEKGSIDIADPSNMLDLCHIWTLKSSCSASSKFIIFLIVHVKKALSTLLIPAICWTHVIFELWNGLAHLRGSVVEHQSVESKGLRFNSSWPHGDSEFFLCLILVTRPETSFFKQNVFAKTTSLGMFDGRSKLCLRKHALWDHGIEERRDSLLTKHFHQFTIFF